jgi:hypothetical protein
MAPITVNNQLSGGRSPDQPHGVGQARVSLLTTVLKDNGNFEDNTFKESTLKGGTLTNDDPFKKDPFKDDMFQDGAFKENDSLSGSDTPKEAGQYEGSAPINIKSSGARNVASNHYNQLPLNLGAQSEAMLHQGCEGLPPKHYFLNPDGSSSSRSSLTRRTADADVAPKVGCYQPHYLSASRYLSRAPSLVIWLSREI